MSTEILPGGENALPVVYGGGEEVKAEESAPSPAAGTEETAASDDALSENEEMSLANCLRRRPKRRKRSKRMPLQTKHGRRAEVEPEMPGDGADAGDCRKRSAGGSARWLRFP